MRCHRCSEAAAPSCERARPQTYVAWLGCISYSDCCALLLDGSSRFLANSLIAEQAEASRLPTGPANRPTLAVATDPRSPRDSLWLEHRLSHGLAHLCPTLRHAGRVPAGDRGSRCCHRAPGIIHAAPVAPYRSCSRAWLRTSAAIALRCAAGAAVPV